MHRAPLPHSASPTLCLLLPVFLAAMCQISATVEQCCAPGTECKRSEGAYSVCCAPDKSKPARPGYQRLEAFSIGLQLLLLRLPTAIRPVASPASCGRSRQAHTMACPTPPICRGVHIRVLRSRRQVLQGCRWQRRLLRDRWVGLAVKQVCLWVLRGYLALIQNRDIPVWQLSEYMQRVTVSYPPVPKHAHGREVCVRQQLLRCRLRRYWHRLLRRQRGRPKQ